MKPAVLVLALACLLAVSAESSVDSDLTPVYEAETMEVAPAEQETETADDNEEEAAEEGEDGSEEEEESDSLEDFQDEEQEFQDEQQEDPNTALAELVDDFSDRFAMAEMTAVFKPSEPVEADHLIHSVSSQEEATKHQEYMNGFEQGYHHAISMMETGAKAYPYSYQYGGGAGAASAYPHVSFASPYVTGGVYANLHSAPFGGYGFNPLYFQHLGGYYRQPYWGGYTPAPPQLPVNLPAPPFIQPAAGKPAEKKDD